jgi:hypothetical protein
MAGPTKTVAVPKVPPLDFVLWDGTDPVDSYALGRGLVNLGWRNQVKRGDQLALAGRRGAPFVLQPAGRDGKTTDGSLMLRGMFEFPRAVLGASLRGDSAGHTGNIVAVSGHGVPGFMFSESLVPLAMSRPMETTASSLAGSAGHWSYQSTPVWAGSSTKVVIFSACRQLQGKPQQFYWSQTMRTPSPVHMILSYRETGPIADASAGVNQRFFKHARDGKTLLEAWWRAHSASTQVRRWAALCYEACVDDKLRDWAKSGSLPSHPDPKGTILYFDSDTPNGVAVVQVTPDVDCWLTSRGSSARLAPWTLCANNALMDLHIQVLGPAGQLKVGDRIAIMASQVRPDYFGPFDIRNLFIIDRQTELVTKSLLASRRVIHDDYPEYGEDTYVLTINPLEGTPPVNADNRSITIPITLGQAQNEHIPLYYFHIAIGGEDGRRYGMKSGQPLLDDFQFGMFLLPWSSS